MSRGLISFIVIVCIAAAAAMIIYLKQDADKAKKRSDTIMQEFKTIDKDLQERSQRLDSLNKAFFDSLRKTDK
jgi:uncharacterized protein YoxC